MSLTNILRILSRALEEIAAEIDDESQSKPSAPVAGKPIKERKVAVKPATPKKKDPTVEKEDAFPAKKQTPVEKKPVRKVSKKKTPAKDKVSPTKKKAPKVTKVVEKKKEKTVAEVVLEVISQAEAPVGRAVISEKTGFKLQKVSDGLHDLKKKGMIRPAGKGVYVKV